jgi:hypothetical protein
LEIWKRVLFADESKYNIFGSDGHNYMRRKPREELRENSFLLQVKYDGGSVTVWECMEASGVENLHLFEDIMNKHVYVNVIREYLKGSAEKLGIKEHFAFYHIDYPKLSVHFVRSGACTTAQK